MKVLVVDDSKAMRMLVLRALRQAGFEIEATEANDGTEAVAALAQERPDLILSDWNMPNMSGIELLREVRALGLDVPFGFVTSETTGKMREEALLAGATFLLGKPFSPESFTEALEGVL